MTQCSQASADFSTLCQQNHTGGMLDAQKKGGPVRIRSSWCKMVAKVVIYRWKHGSFTPSPSCNTVTFNRMSRKIITNTSGNKAIAVEKSFEPVSMLLCCRCAGIYSPYCTRFVWYESFLSLQWSLAYSRCFFSGGEEGLLACFSFIENTLISPYT